MKLALFSDLHIHGYKDFARTLPSGRNSRLQHTLDVLSTIRQQCKAGGIKHVLFGGDLFHKKGILSVGMYQAVYEELVKFKDDRLNLVLVVGNHDQATLDGKTHAIKTFEQVATVVDEPGRVLLNAGAPSEQCAVRCVPYMDDQKAFKQALKRTGEHLLLAHGALNGAVTGPVEYQPEHPLDVSDLPDGYDFKFFGHYHRQQKMADKCWYIGSPLQHSRGEAGELLKGYIVYDTQTRKFKNVPLGLPEFMKVVWEDVVVLKHNSTTTGTPSVSVKGQFVDVEVDPDEYDLQDVAAQVLKAGAEAVNPIPILKTLQPSQQRLEVDPSMDPKKLVDKYIEEYAPDELDKQELRKRARAYLEGV